MIGIKGTKDFYNKTASDWAEKGYRPEGEVVCLKEFLADLNKECKVLDLCCGCGYESQRIKKYGYEVVGIDFSGESLKIAREKNPEIMFYEDNMLNDYSYIGTVDAIIVIAGIVHVEQKDLRLAFERMHNVLKDKGAVLLSIREGSGKMPERSLCVLDEEEYDRNFIGHTLDELVVESHGLFQFEKELESDMQVWKNYVFKRV